MATGQRSRFERQNQPHGGVIQIVTDPGAVRQHQVTLQLGQRIAWYGGLGQHAKAGINTVNGTAAVENGANRGFGTIDPGAALVVELDSGAALKKLAQCRKR